MRTYNIVIWNGESETLYYIVKQLSEKEEDWEIIKTCHNLDQARTVLDALNEWDKNSSKNKIIQ